MSKSDSEAISILPHAVAIALFLLEAETYINGHLKKVVHSLESRQKFTGHAKTTEVFPESPSFHKIPCFDSRSMHCIALQWLKHQQK